MSPPEEELYSKYYTIPQIIPFGNGADEDFELSDIVDKMDIKPHIPELLSKLEYSLFLYVFAILVIELKLVKTNGSPPLLTINGCVV